MDQEKIHKAVEIANRMNNESKIYGKSSDNTVMELLDIIDHMNQDEVNEYLRLVVQGQDYKINQHIFILNKK